jgi:UDP-N-acetyl-D-glucosamine/UDP-N-acetyl-D-galactosamine dehydrogenase
MKINNIKIGILGLGYVGLPLAVEFSKKFNVIGFDINYKRIDNLKKHKDTTLEVAKIDLIKSKKLNFTSTISDLSKCNIFIITVPTPIDKNNSPDLKPIISSSKLVGSIIKKKNFVIYESTVYPGLTEEVCVPIIEKISKLKLNKDFYVGYSPERINPGDTKHKISDIVKITSGSNNYASNFVNRLYKKIITAGTYKTSSIKVAEAAKVIENTQRDLNIALMNELSMIFDKLKIDTNEVINAASTKWNFNKFVPGLVGGHCIGVDPYYLTFKSFEAKYNPKIILAGRKINDNMHKFIIKKLTAKIKEKQIKVNKPKILILGLTFKENCPDFRNSKSLKLAEDLTKKKFSVSCHDPYFNSIKQNQINFKIVKKFKKSYFDAILILTPHKEYLSIGIKKIKSFAKKKSVIFDVKSVFSKKDSDIRI